MKTIAWVCNARVALVVMLLGMLAACSSKPAVDPNVAREQARQRTEREIQQTERDADAATERLRERMERR